MGNGWYTSFQQAKDIEARERGEACKKNLVAELAEATFGFTPRWSIKWYLDDAASDAEHAGA